MRKMCFAFLISLVMCQVLGQGNYYIYIQSADHQPFYVRSGSRIFHSSGNGYLVMEHLASASYDLMIGFPDTPSSEWQFNCSVNDDDVAFILKNENGKKVELSGLKNESKQSGKKVELKPEKVKILAVKQATGIVSNDPFSSMLAEVVDDPTIRQQPVIIPRPEDSLKLAKTTVADSAKLVAVNTPASKKSAEEKPATDNQAIAKTSPALTAPQSAKNTKTIAAKAADSTAAIAKAPVQNSKAATENKAPGEKNEDKALAPAPDHKLKDGVVADSAVSDASKPVAVSEEPKNTKDRSIAKATVKEEKAADNAKAEEKASLQANASANKSASSSELINAAMEEADKKKQSGVNTGAEKIVLGASISITKTLQRRSNEGMELIYNDQTDDGTLYVIRILIPANK